MTPTSWRRLLPLAGSLVCFAVLLVPGARSQGGPTDGIYYSPQLTFRIPFQTDPADRRIREVQLYASDDQGRSWQPVATARPNERWFTFPAKHEGWYWFTVRTIDVEDRAYPATVEQAQPRLKVCVDTQPPVVTLRAVQSPHGAAAVEWTIRDDNLDLENLRLEYRLAESATGRAGEWVPLAGQKIAAGQRAWNPRTKAPLEARLRVKGLARN